MGTVEHALATLPADQELLRCRLLTTLAFELDRVGSYCGYQVSCRGGGVGLPLGDVDALVIAIYGRVWHTSRSDGLAERVSLGAELLDLPAKSVTTEALGHVILMAASVSAADFRPPRTCTPTGRHASPSATTSCSPPSRLGFYRALRKALSADVPAAEELYRRGAALMDRFGQWQHGAFVSVMGRFCLRTMTGQVGDMVGELERLQQAPVPTPAIAAPYALALAAAGRVPEARAVAAQMPAVRRGHLWLPADRHLRPAGHRDRRRRARRGPATGSCCPTRRGRRVPTPVRWPSGPPPRSSATSPATSA